ncbi:MAG: adenosine-specific kinase [Nitrososphaeria archaeon]|nr:adenosine-specific kinase [Nitrososphaeria archaeon]
MIELKVVDIDVPEGVNVILGTTHFIKSVEDIYEAVANSVPGAKFAVAFCEASGKRLVRSEGNDLELRTLAEKNALKLSCGHTFILYLKNAYPINVLEKIKNVYEVCSIHAATANPLQIIVAETSQGRGVLGVVDGFSSLGIEDEKDRRERKEFLRKIGYKL